MLTHIGNPDGYSLIQEIQYHDDDKIEARGCDGGGQLRGQQASDGRQVLSVLHQAGKGSVHRKAIHDHGYHASYDEGHLRKGQGFETPDSSEQLQAHNFGNNF